jgi:SAM-dependent methyltransferase
MTGYYSEKLSADRLERAYQIAPPRVRQYLSAEIGHVLTKIEPGATVLELGCGYGRVMAYLAQKAGQVYGIDTSMTSLHLAASRLPSDRNFMIQMDAARLGFIDRAFDVVVCIQNGISAFKVDPVALLREAARVTRHGGRVLFSSYSEKFWTARLEWFELQAGAGLVGKIDYEATGNGVIVCADGFRATTVGGEEFARLAAQAGVRAAIDEVDDSSLFCEILV